MIWRVVDQINPTVPVPAPRKVPAKRRKGPLEREPQRDEAERKPSRKPTEVEDLGWDDTVEGPSDDDQHDGLIDEYV